LPEKYIFEAWIGRSGRTEIARPLFQNTETKIEFQVLVGPQENRIALDISGYEISFASRIVSGNEQELFSPKTCINDDPINGICSVQLLALDLAIPDEIFGELNLRSTGIGQAIDDRVQFTYRIAETLE
jgi:hypothetical protein